MIQFNSKLEMKENLNRFGNKFCLIVIPGLVIAVIVAGILLYTIGDPFHVVESVLSSMLFVNLFFSVFISLRLIEDRKV